VVLVEDDLDVTLPVGASEQFRLPGFGSSGYQWFFRVDDDRVVRVTRASREPESGDRLRVGDSVDEGFIVEALNPGTAVILFELARPWEREAVTRRHRVTILSEPRQ
jgi:predicted secreted protein